MIVSSEYKILFPTHIREQEIDIEAELSDAFYHAATEGRAIGFEMASENMACEAIIDIAPHTSEEKTAFLDAVDSGRYPFLNRFISAFRAKGDQSVLDAPTFHFDIKAGMADAMFVLNLMRELSAITEEIPNSEMLVECKNEEQFEAQEAQDYLSWSEKFANNGKPPVPPSAPPQPPSGGEPA